MAELSARTLVMAVQGVEAEIRRIKGRADGDVSRLEPDDQELLLAYSQAATELKTHYLARRQIDPGLPPYEQLVAAD